MQLRADRHELCRDLIAEARNVRRLIGPPHAQIAKGCKIIITHELPHAVAQGDEFVIKRVERICVCAEKAGNGGSRRLAHRPVRNLLVTPEAGKVHGLPGKLYTAGCEQLLIFAHEPVFLDRAFDEHGGEPPDFALREREQLCAVFAVDLRAEGRGKQRFVIRKRIRGVLRHFRIEKVLFRLIEMV